MDQEKIAKAYLPMTETAWYILLALQEERHGYGIMQLVETMTEGRIRLGAGTLYGTLSKMEKDGLIQAVAEVDRRKIYQVTATGKTLLSMELTRLRQLVRNGEMMGVTDHEDEKM